VKEKGSIIMGIFDDFEYKENYLDEEKVIEILKKILRAIHLKNYRDILDCVDGSEVDDVRDLLEYINDSLHLNDFDNIVVGTWIDKANANAEARKFINTLSNKNIFFIGIIHMKYYLCIHN